MAILKTKRYVFMFEIKKASFAIWWRKLTGRKKNIDISQ